MLDSSTVRVRFVTALIFVFCVVWFGNLGYRSLVRPDIYRELTQRGLPIHLLAADARRVIASKS